MIYFIILFYFPLPCLFTTVFSIFKESGPEFNTPEINVSRIRSSGIYELCFFEPTYYIYIYHIPFGMAYFQWGYVSLSGCTLV